MPFRIRRSLKLEDLHLLINLNGVIARRTVTRTIATVIINKLCRPVNIRFLDFINFEFGCNFSARFQEFLRVNRKLNNYKTLAIKSISEVFFTGKDGADKKVGLRKAKEQIFL